MIYFVGYKFQKSDITINLIQWFLSGITTVFLIGTSEDMKFQLGPI
jgi:hypothetical protein